MNELKEIRNRALLDVRTVVVNHLDDIKDAYRWTMRLERITRKEGLLALEYEMGCMPKDMPLCGEVASMARLVTDGTEEEFMADWMTLKYLSEGYEGIKGVLFYLYARSLLLIKDGENPYRIEEIFNAVIPSDIISFDRQYSIRNDDKFRKIAEIKNLLSSGEKECLRNISSHLLGLSGDEWKIITGKRSFYNFDRIIPYLDDDIQLLVKEHANENRYYTIMQFPDILKEAEFYQIETEVVGIIYSMRKKPEPVGILSGVLHRNKEEMSALVREVDNSTTAIALIGESKEIRDKFLENMPLRMKFEVEDDMEYMIPVRRCDVEAAQVKIRKIAMEKLGWDWQEQDHL